jgi:glycosyltransferase involved in cell wall biosynthesis
MKVAVNFNTSYYTGVGVYSMGLLGALGAPGAAADGIEAFVRFQRIPRPEWLPPAVTFKATSLRGRAQQILDRFSVPAETVFRLGSDLLHNLNPEPIPTRLPVITTIHDVSWRFLGAEFESVVSRKWMREAERTIRSSTHLCVDSSVTADHLLHGGVSPEKISVVHLGVDRIFFDSDARAKGISTKYELPDEFILYVGALNTRKNIGALIEGMRLVKRCPPLICVGPAPVGGPEAWGVREPAARHLGVVPREDLPGLMAASTALVFPTLFEGFGLPLVEAMAAGTCVLASDLPIFRELAGDAPSYFDPRDPSDIAAALGRFLEQGPDAREHSRQQCRRVASRYSWETCAEGTIEAYRRTLR